MCFQVHLSGKVEIVALCTQNTDIVRTQKYFERKNVAHLIGLWLGMGPSIRARQPAPAHQMSKPLKTVQIMASRVIEQLSLWAPGGRK